MNSPRHHRADVVLRDGSTVHVRPVTATDAPAVRAFLEHLSPESIALRFFSNFPDLDRAVRWATEADQHRYGLIATSSADRQVVAHAGWERDPDRPERAEIGLRHRRRHPTQRARHHPPQPTHPGQAGVAVLSAEVLPQNQHMLHVFGDSGIPVSRRPATPPQRRCKMAIQRDGRRSSAELLSSRAGRTSMASMSRSGW
jgi:acetate---CoA ligase (ADP-forming)